MIEGVLNLLRENRPLIILTEIVGFLHDLGKLDNECFRKHNERIRTEFQIENTYKPVIPKDNIPKIIFTLFRSAKLKEVLQGVAADKMLKFLCEGQDEPEIFSPIFWHHFDRPQFNPRNNFEKLIANADSQDSNEDRGAQEEKSPEKFFIATPFGFEELLDDKIKDKLHEFCLKDRTECRLRFYQEFAEILSKITYEKNGEIKFKDDGNLWRELRNEFYEIVEKYFPLSLAETRRPSNDINLFDHCYMTGSISKVGIVGFILSEKLREEFKETISQGREYKFNFKLLVVGFDGYSFLTKVNRLPDFVGRSEKLNEVRRKIKEIVEFELPIGNLIYEDLGIMCFLIPDLTSLESGNEIIDELRRKIISTVMSETNGLIVPLVEVCGKKDGEACKYIGPLIENAKEVTVERTNPPYSVDLELTRKLPWVEDWKKSWMWKCDDCKESGVSDRKFEKCPKCTSNKLRQKPREKCYVCGYAPEYPIPEGVVSTKGEKLCRYCYNLRLEGMARRWNEKETIWLDQIRDEKPSNRIALIIGKLSPIEKWLSGEYVKETTFTVFANPVEGKNKCKKLNQIKGILKTKGEIRSRLYEEVKKVLGHNLEALEYFNSEIEKMLRKGIINDESIGSFIQKLTNLLIKKPASPSRLRRVWKELESFSDKSIELARKFFEKKKRKQLALEVDKKLKPSTLGKSEIGTIICKDEKTVLTIDYLDFTKDGKKLDELSEEEIKEWLVGRIIEVEWEDGRKENIQIVDLIGIDCFVPIVPIYATAGEFMFLCPAKHALEITTLIRDEFLKRFEKVLGRLTLNIGVIYFKYKQPLYLVLDAGRRIVKEFGELSFEEVKLRIRKENDSYVISEVGLSINPRLEDGTDDWYYSTVKMADTGEWMPLLTIQKEAEIKLFPNHFDYEYLESTQNRFNIGLCADRRREHRILGEFGPRPYLLENIEELIKLWNMVNPRNGKLTTSQIRKLEYICASKIKEWKLKDKNLVDDGKLREFIETSVKNICGKLNRRETEEVAKSILSGMFFDVIELFVTLKSEIGGEQYG